MSEKCETSLGGYTCALDRLHGGACIAESGHWWAQYDSGRTDKEPFPPLPPDPYASQDLREVWT